MYKQECPVQVICSRDVEAVLFKGEKKKKQQQQKKKKKTQTIHTVSCLCTKQSNTLERICEHESTSESVKTVANIHLSLQFCGKAALKRRLSLSNTERAKRARKKMFCAFFHQKY